MAFESSMEPSLVKEILQSMDLFPPRSPTESSDVTSSPNIPPPLCLYALPDSPNYFPLKPLTPIPSSIKLLDNQMHDLLRKKLIHLILQGNAFDTVAHHRENLIREIGSWLNVPVFFLDTIDLIYQEQLIHLLGSNSKCIAKHVPLDVSEWTKHLQHWIRNNVIEDRITTRTVYRILAVDGFKGISPNDLKSYLKLILLPLRPEYKMHTHGVRAMYDVFQENPLVVHLTGTDSACIIYWALINLFSHSVAQELWDDQVEYKVRYAKQWIERNLELRAEYFRDINNVNEVFLETLCSVYTEQFADHSLWKVVGKELLKSIQLEKDEKDEKEKKKKKRKLKS